MSKSTGTSTLSLTALGAMLATLYGTPIHAAQQPLTRVWVANTGTDNLSCGAIAAPCRTFFFAQNNVADGGEISVLTPGDYGPLGISKSLDVSNEGVGEATTLPVNPSETSVMVVAASGDVVKLRGLVIDGQVIGRTGIFIGNGATAVHVQNCVIKNFEAAGGGFGIFMVTAPQSQQLFVSDTIIFNNGSNAATGGIVIQPQTFGASLQVVLDRVHLENNVRGLWVDGSQGSGEGVHLVLRDSVVSGNAEDGIRATSATGQTPALLLVERTSVVNNAGKGIHAEGPHATMLLNDNTIARNGVGMSADNGGQLISYGNNTNDDNLGGPGAPTSTRPQM